MRIARDQELDLVEISPNATPPVCKVMSYSKYKYEQSKKDREQSKKNKNKDIKEIRFKPFIGIGDYNNKLKRIKFFLEDKHKVKVVIRMTGRSSFENADLLMGRILKELEEVSKVESIPKREGRTIIAQFQPI